MSVPPTLSLDQGIAPRVDDGMLFGGQLVLGAADGL
jgi:hypothetical protein